MSITTGSPHLSLSRETHNHIFLFFFGQREGLGLEPQSVNICAQPLSYTPNLKIMKGLNLKSLHKYKTNVKKNIVQKIHLSVINYRSQI